MNISTHDEKNLINKKHLFKYNCMFKYQKWRLLIIFIYLFSFLANFTWCTLVYFMMQTCWANECKCFFVLTQTTFTGFSVSLLWDFEKKVLNLLFLNFYNTFKAIKYSIKVLRNLQIKLYVETMSKLDFNQAYLWYFKV